MLLEVGGGVIKAAFEGFRERPRQGHHPLAAAAGYLVLGVILGGLSALVLPRPVLRPFLFPGVSTILSPVAAGLVMGIWGEHRRARGHVTTNLATWYGGAALALGIALARFLALQP